jgi:hypothetical protein
LTGRCFQDATLSPSPKVREFQHHLARSEPCLSTRGLADEGFRHFGKPVGEHAKARRGNVSVPKQIWYVRAPTMRSHTLPLISVQHGSTPEIQSSPGYSRT